MTVRTIPLHLRLSPEAHANAVIRAAQERRPLATLLALMLEDELTRPAATTVDDERKG